VLGRGFWRAIIVSVAHEAVGVFALWVGEECVVKNMAAKNSLAKNVYAAFTSGMQRK